MLVRKGCLCRGPYSLHSEGNVVHADECAAKMKRIGVEKYFVIEANKTCKYASEWQSLRCEMTANPDYDLYTYK